MEIKGVNWYLEKGVPRRVAEYYVAGRKRLVKVTPYPAYTLILEYEDGERRIYDCNQLLETIDFLRDYSNFCRVYVDDAGAVCWDRDPAVDSETVWENKVDLCPDGCYVYSRHLFRPCDNPKNYETASFEMDTDIYLEAEKRFAEYGLTMEEAMNLYMEDVVRENGLPAYINQCIDLSSKKDDV